MTQSIILAQVFRDKDVSKGNNELVSTVIIRAVQQYMLTLESKVRDLEMNIRKLESMIDEHAPI